MGKIKYVVYSSDMENNSFIKEQKKRGAKCIVALDVRSAVYMATGICAQNNNPVIVCVNSSNASRSAFSGMTEAFYRKLPVALVTFGQELDYSTELADVVVNHYNVSTESDIEELLDGEYPMHIEVKQKNNEIKKIKCDKTQKLLSSELDENTYLYIGQGIEITNNNYRCKVVQGGMSNCYEGAMANVLGASLANLKERYIGLISEEEFLHDINTLGNINANDSLLFIVLADKKNNLIIDYAKSLNFETLSIKESEIELCNIKKTLKDKKETVIMLYKEE